MTERVETLVIGGGVMGLAAAWHLSRRGRQVTLLERYDVGNHHGASHGATRNFNQTYADAGYLGMIVEAERLWRELEAESGATLLDKVGIVNHGNVRANEVTRAAMTSAGIATELVGADDAAERWSGMRFDGPVLYAPASGRIRASEVLTALRDVAVAHGAELRVGSRALAIEITADERVRVATEGGEILADRAIVTAGAWTSRLIGDLIRIPKMVVTQEQPAHFAVNDTGATWPGFNHTAAVDRPGYDYWPSVIYGMLTPGEGVKVGWHGAGPVTDPDERSFRSEPRQLELLRRYVSEWLPGADPDRFTEISCTYTTTPDSNFFLEQAGPLVVGAGFSGHGFKFAVVIGRILADLAEGKDARPRLAKVPF